MNGKQLLHYRLEEQLSANADESVGQLEANAEFQFVWQDSGNKGQLKAAILIFRPSGQTTQPNPFGGIVDPYNPPTPVSGRFTVWDRIFATTGGSWEYAASMTMEGAQGEVTASFDPRMIIDGEG